MVVLEAGTLAAFGLFLVRTSAFVLATPFFGAQATFGGVKVGLIASLALILFSVHGAPLPEASSPPVFVACAVRELVIGLSLAFVLQAVVLAVRVAGEMIGSEMAFNMASVVDPATGANTPLITQLFEALFLLGLLAVDGHHLLLRALAASFQRAPAGQLGLNAGFYEAASAMVSDLFAAGITFAAPVLVLLVLSSVLVGLVARTMPQVNVLEVGFSLRILVGLGAMFLFAPLVAPALGRLYGLLGSGLEQALAALEV
jgi:flagellar biosynthetic protein FliR